MAEEQPKKRAGPKIKLFHFNLKKTDTKNIQLNSLPVF